MAEVRTIFIALDGSSSRPFINLDIFRGVSSWHRRIQDWHPRFKKMMSSSQGSWPGNFIQTCIGEENRSSYWQRLEKYSLGERRQAIAPSLQSAEAKTATCTMKQFFVSIYIYLICRECANRTYLPNTTRQRMRNSPNLSIPINPANKNSQSTFPQWAHSSRADYRNMGILHSLPWSLRETCGCEQRVAVDNKCKFPTSYITGGRHPRM